MGWGSPSPISSRPSLQKGIIHNAINQTHPTEQTSGELQREEALSFSYVTNVYISVFLTWTETRPLGLRGEGNMGGKSNVLPIYEIQYIFFLNFSLALLCGNLCQWSERGGRQKKYGLNTAPIHHNQTTFHPYPPLLVSPPASCPNSSEPTSLILSRIFPGLSPPAVIPC